MRRSRVLLLHLSRRLLDHLLLFILLLGDLLLLPTNLLLLRRRPLRFLLMDDLLPGHLLGLHLLKELLPRLLPLM